MWTVGIAFVVIGLAMVVLPGVLSLGAGDTEAIDLPGRFVWFGLAFVVVGGSLLAPRLIKQKRQDMHPRNEGPPQVRRWRR